MKSLGGFTSSARWGSKVLCEARDLKDVLLKARREAMTSLRPEDEAAFSVKQGGGTSSKKHEEEAMKQEGMSDVLSCAWR